MLRISGERATRRVRRVTVNPAPGVGVDGSVSVPGGRMWRPVAIRAQLVTSAAVAARAARLQLSVDGSIVLDIPPVATQAASLTGRYQWRRGDTQYALGAAQLMTFPDIDMPPGATIATLTDLIDVADQWGAMTLYVVESTMIDAELDFPEGSDDSADD